MDRLKRFGVDGYMLLLIAMAALGALLPVRGRAADILSDVTFWAVGLLFVLYGARLDPSAVAAGMLNWRLRLLIFLTTFALFPLLGLGFARAFGGLIGPELALGLLFLSALPSTAQSSIAFTAMAGGNVPAALRPARGGPGGAVLLRRDQEPRQRPPHRDGAVPGRDRRRDRAAGDALSPDPAFRLRADRPAGGAAQRARGRRMSGRGAFGLSRPARAGRKADEPRRNAE